MVGIALTSSVTSQQVSLFGFVQVLQLADCYHIQKVIYVTNVAVI